MRSSPEDQTRVLLFGMRCSFTVAAMRSLLASGSRVMAVALPGAIDSYGRPGVVRSLPLVGGRADTVDAVAAAAGIPVVSLRGLHAPEQRMLIARAGADIFAAACFPWKLPSRVRDLSRHGCLNLHPSLLPRWRGPEPLFWTFRTGDRETGVTVHVMDDGFDTGPIVAQERMSVPHLVDGAALERELGTRGGALLAVAVRSAGEGSLRAAPQAESETTTAPTPTDDDFVVSTGRPALELADMVAGIAPLWGPLTLVSHIDGARISARTVLDVDEETTPARPFQQRGDAVIVACAPGSVTFVQISTGAA